MTGPEHYQEAERLLATAYEGTNTTYEGENAEAARAITEAGVHATLALAAATALSDPSRSAPRATVPEWDAWQKAAGEPGKDYDVKDSFA